MAEKKGVGHAYNVDFLNVVFAASSLFLFLSVIWMVWDDFDRDWKNTQRRFAQLEYEVTQAQRQQAVGAVDKNKIAAARGAEDGGRAADRGQPGRRSTSWRTSWPKRTRALFRATLDYNYLKATYDQDRYDFETTRVAAPQAASTARKQKAAEDQAKRLAELNLAMEKATADKAEIQKQLERLHRAGRRRAEADRGAPDRADAARQAPRRARAERHQELLPRRAAARLHGADASRCSRSSCRTSSTT